MKTNIIALATVIIVCSGFYSVNANSAPIVIGSSAHYQSEEAAMPVPATAGPVDCDIQSPAFSACLSAHASDLVNLGDIKPARSVLIDADGTVHLLAGK